MWPPSSFQSTSPTAGPQEQVRAPQEQGGGPTFTLPSHCASAIQVAVAQVRYLKALGSIRACGSQKAIKGCHNTHKIFRNGAPIKNWGGLDGAVFWPLAFPHQKWLLHFEHCHFLDPFVHSWWINTFCHRDVSHLLILFVVISPSFANCWPTRGEICAHRSPYSKQPYCPGSVHVASLEAGLALSGWAKIVLWAWLSKSHPSKAHPPGWALAKYGFPLWLP